MEEHCSGVLYLLLHKLRNDVSQRRHAGARHRLGNKRARLQHRRVEPDHAQYDVDSSSASHEFCKIARILPKRIPRCGGES